MSQIAHPLLKASGAGSVVFVSSVAGLLHIGSGSIYGASKGECLLTSSLTPCFKSALENNLVFLFSFFTLNSFFGVFKSFSCAVSKMIFKKYHFHAFLSENYYKKQPQPHF